MKNRDLENFYSKINGSIKLISAYVQQPNLINIIKACRLKPYSAFSKGFDYKTTFERHWVDEFGNSLILNNKHFNILLNDLNINENTNISSDLFFGRSLKETIKYSKLIMIVSGKYDDKDFCLLGLFGEDEYLNTFMFSDKWFKVSSLFFGIRALNQLFRNVDKRNIVQINHKNIKLELECEIACGITTKLPAIGSINEIVKLDCLKGLF